MIKSIQNLKVGDKVHYQPSYYKKEQWENGIVKSIPEKSLISGEITSVFVVYNCADDWDNYKNYTGQSTKLNDLHPGWRHE